MKNSFSNLSTREKEWLDQYLNGTIGTADFEAMQNHMVEHASFRKIARQYLALDDSLAKLGETGEELSSSWEKPPAEPREKIGSFPRLLPLAAAAGIAFLLGSGLMFWLGKSETPAPSIADYEKTDSPSAKGFAVVKALFAPTWSNDSELHNTGDSLGSETFHLASGTAEIQFYSGALMTIEGPAEISLKSAWEADCREGAVRLQVPPAARGFKLNSPDTKIVDLGTEFGLVVKDGESKVEVFEGEIVLSHLDAQERHLFKGDALTLTRSGPPAPLESGQISIPNSKKFRPRATELNLESFRTWQNHRDELARDPQLIAYYGFDHNIDTGLMPNLALPRNPDLDGTVILAEPVSGRWHGLKPAFEFRRPGSRIRVNIPGEFEALTFACWVRIDSLDRRYNALFMADSYEDGEPHWQIRDDGKLMLSVMVDETGRHPVYPQKSRYHHIYFSPKIWDLSMSGQWIHLASVFDPAARVVAHYMNGEEISREEIKADFVVETLRIGNSEIGNWSQPFRKDPNFAIRNLNGRMDELAIFQSALTSPQIKQLFQHSRSDQ